MKIRNLFVLLVFSVLITQTPALANKLSLTIASREPVTSEDGTGFLDQIIAEMFRRIGVDAEVTFYQSSARGLENANNGTDDGVGLRVIGLEKKFPNLVRIPESIIVNDFVAFSTRQTLSTTDWHSLDEYEIAYILGWQIFQKNLEHHEHTFKVKSNTQLFSLLAKDRVDFILHERWQGTWHAKILNLKAVAHEPPLIKREMFAYLHKKHAPIVDKAAAALVAMKADGTYQKIIDNTLTVLLPRTR